MTLVQFKPIDRMWERVEIARSDSDTALFSDLMLLGELLTKLVITGMVAAIADDRDRNRYRHLHRLVRADGIGEWGQVLDDLLKGPSSQSLLPTAKEEQRELNERVGTGAWQYESTLLIHECLQALNNSKENLNIKLDGRKWFSSFAELRNKTKGHGAITSGVYGVLCPKLEESIRMVIDNYRMFKRPWAYLYRNLSGKYRVTKLTEEDSPFDYLKTSKSSSLPHLMDGVYVYLDQPVRVELIESSVDAIDFYLPNGGFYGKRYEVISYVTGETLERDASIYAAPANTLPDSETQGIGSLEIQGKCFGNLPPIPNDYIHRVELENDLHSILANDRHAVVTLTGRGGIGKTSLALSVLHEITDQDRFEAVLWFSARDIDLSPELGPKPVRPHVLTEKEIAAEFVQLMKPAEAATKGFDHQRYLSSALTSSPTGKPYLFIFDNFETVRNPIDLYTWLDTYIRLPNTVLITTRFREFKGDYPIEVLGMAENEFEELVKVTSSKLGISHLLTDAYRRDLYRESDGHPYVVKVLLGEVAKVGKLTPVTKIVASKDEILDALFERTYSGLSPVARRVFLTLSRWRSTVPQLAVEAVLLRPINERMDVSEAIDELSRSSFIEITTSEEDNQLFLTVPLSASAFGKRKLEVSPMKGAVESDIQLLQAFGASQRVDIRHGVRPRIHRMFRFIAERISKGNEELETHIPMLELIARKYTPAWLLLADLHEEFSADEGEEKAKDAIRRYLESSHEAENQQRAWQRLTEICQRTNDPAGEAHALVERSEIPEESFSSIAAAARRLDFLLRNKIIVAEEDRHFLARRMVRTMQNRLDEMDADDCSVAAWLCIRADDKAQARYFTKLGLDKDPENAYCQKLAESSQFQNHAVDHHDL